jgi:TetR/AcrR family transcriptional regulator, transcriptional repressor for nem operon
VTNSAVSGTAASVALPGKRERLVAAATQMLYEHGVEKTTLADIAAAADVPLGNVYYYFKTKDALVAAVIETYGQAYDVMSAELDQQPTPQARLKALIQAWVGNRELLASHGCPVGTLTCELDKRTDSLRAQAATVLAQLVGWAQRQFEAMRRPDARELAVALVAAYEGIALLANTLEDPGLVTAEGRRLERWIDDLACAAA